MRYSYKILRGGTTRRYQVLIIRPCTTNPGYPSLGSAYNPTSLCPVFSLTVTLLAKLAKSTELRFLSGALGAAPATGISLISVLTLVKTSCVKRLVGRVRILRHRIMALGSGDENDFSF